MCARGLFIWRFDHLAISAARRAMDVDLLGAMQSLLEVVARPFLKQGGPARRRGAV